MKLNFTLTALLISLTIGTQANNVQISNVSLVNQNTTANTTMIKFDASWENSWRSNTLESNWDAIWVFAKYRIKGQSLWNHATIDLTGHTGPSTCKIDSTVDGRGVFIRASNPITLQNVNYTNINVRWAYGADGLQDGDSADICVFAIEMVFVPQGAFYLGDGNPTADGNFKQAQSSIGLPFQVTNEGAITLGGSASNNLGITGTTSGGAVDDFNASATQSLPATFPKGFNAFYCMKYEVSQGQYAEFLNKLNSIQASQRFPNSNGFNRHTIGGAWPNHTSSTPHRACNYISYIDALTYADWAGLRPMTELEYEKACRGTAFPAIGEYAWGSTTINSISSLVNDGTASETSSGSIANSNFGQSSSFGPMRCGWATGTSPGTRESTGSTYYGIRDMTGNILELVITVGNSSGRSFNGSHGDGSIDAIGIANVSNWSVNTAAYGYKGGHFNSGVIRYLSVSNRYFSNGISSTRQTNSGFRCVRSF